MTKGRVQLAILVLLVAAAGGWWLYKHRARTLPALVLQDAEGQSVDFDKLRGGKEHTVLVFLMAGDQVSKFSLGLVQQQQQQWSQKMAFAGLFLGKQDAADRYAEDEEAGFPIYGLRDAKDPFAVNELIEAVGSAYGTGSAVYGGTVVVVNAERKVLINLAQDDVRTLPKELTDLND